MFAKSRNLSKKCTIFRTSTPRRSRSNVGLDGQRKQFSDQQDVLPVDRRYFAQEERRGNAIIKKNPNKYQNLKQGTSNWSSDQNKTTRQDRQKSKIKISAPRLAKTKRCTSKRSFIQKINTPRPQNQNLRTSACKNKTKRCTSKRSFIPKRQHIKTAK